jgi:hypothetical protein
MSSSVSGRGGLRTMYLKHLRTVSKGQHIRDVDTYVETLVKLLLLLVYYAEAEVDFVGFLKIGFHAHHLRERFFCMLKGSVPIVQYPDAVPEFGFLSKVSLSDAKEAERNYLPSDQTDGRVPADRQNKPAANRPS